MALRYWVTGGDGNYNSTTNWSDSSGGVSGSSIPTTADDAIWDANSGAGTVVINVASVAKSVDFTNFTGTVDFQNTLAVAGNITLGLGMSFANTTGAPVLRVTAAATLTSNNAIFPYTFSFLTAAVTITLADTWEVGELVHDVSTGNLTVNGDTIFINRNLTNLNTLRYILGTTVFVMKGIGTLSSNVTTTGALLPNLVFNTTGTITITGVVGHPAAAIWTYTSGTIITTGTTFYFAGGTIDLDGIIWEEVYYSGIGTVTHLSDFVYRGTLSTLVTTGSKNLNGFSIRHIGPSGGLNNLIGTAGGSTRLGGTTIFSFEGSGSILTGGSSGAVGIPININTSGTYIADTVFAIPGSTFTYTSGTIDFSSTELRIQHNNQTTTFNGISSLNFNLLNIGTSQNDIFIVLNDTMYVDTIDCANSTNTTTVINRFSGTSPFVCNIFNVGGGRYQQIELKDGINYQVNSKFETYPGSISLTQYRTLPLTQPLIKSTVNGLKANITLPFGASQELMYLQFQDIDASNGQTLWVFGSVSSVSNCNNINAFTQPKAVGF